MKFAKEIEADLVPEWRVKYLDYRAGKRKVKAVAKALSRVRNASTTANPPTPFSGFSRPRQSPAVGSHYATTPRTPGVRASSSARKKSPATTFKTLGNADARAQNAGTRPEDVGRGQERRRFPPSGRTARNMEDVNTHDADFDPQPLQLPDPALPDPGMHLPTSPGSSASQPEPAVIDSRTGLVSPDGADAVADAPASHRIRFERSLLTSPFRPRRSSAMPSVTQSGPSDRRQTHPVDAMATGAERRDMPLIRRLWSDTVKFRHRGLRSGGSADGSMRGPPAAEWNTTAYRDLDEKEAEFFRWLHGQLDMIETFYRDKEEEAIGRLEVLKVQLGRMRDLRSKEVEKSRQKKRKALEHANRARAADEPEASNTAGPSNVIVADGTQSAGPMGTVGRTISDGVVHARARHEQDPIGSQKPWYAPIERRFGFGSYKFGLNSEAMARMGPSGYNYDIEEEVEEEHDSDSAEPDSDGSSASEQTKAVEGDRNGNGNGPASPKERTDGHIRAPNGEAGRIPTDEEEQDEHHIRTDTRRDFVRRAKMDEKVPYDRAKRQLKLALQEFYRGLELLKSYALLNRTAFRKINKKYDKVVDARPTLQFFSNKVNGNAYFVQSGVLDQIMVAVEDLYAKYFARGNRKVAVNKLRSRSRKPGEDETGSTFRVGALLAGGTVFAVEGLIFASELVYGTDIDPGIQEKTNFLLQLYGGYFVILVLFLGFVMDAGIWTRSKVNYSFVFEFDTRHHLHWKQLAELPCLLYFLFGLFFFLNFIPYTPSDWFIWWPVWLVGLSVIIIFMPLPILYHRSRSWFLRSNARLLLAGLFPVEFRDFFLGDMFCSLTYSIGNLEIFFCLYAHLWNNPDQCNSSNSRLLGFFSTLPGIWRAMQCIRRYVDTRNAFPHLANCAKYFCTILYYMTLSLYRIDRKEHYFIAFVFFATLNAIYVSIWDVFMDWSLGDASAPHKYLRRELGYKKAWVYYVAMVIDPLIRFNWIFYAIFRQELQHSAILAFFVALTEVLRRVMWTIFRVENEHCTNVGRFRASRDVSLPYSLPPNFDRKQNTISSMTPENTTQARPVQVPAALGPSTPGFSSSVDVEAGSAPAGRPSYFRRRTMSAGQQAQQPFGSASPLQRGLQRVGTAISMAHAQDFERKRKPDAISGKSPSVHGSDARDDREYMSGNVAVVDSEDEDEDPEDEEEQRDIAAVDELVGTLDEDGEENKQADDKLTMAGASRGGGSDGHGRM